MGVKGLIFILGILKVQSCIALWSCSVNDDCSSLVGSICTSGSCVCPSGTESVKGGTLCADIAPYYASPCHEDHQCSRLMTSYECRLTENSLEGSCHCRRGSHYFRGRCWLSIEHGQSCSSNEQCLGLPDPFSMTCSSGTCDCAEGYYLRQKGECRKAAGLNEQCVVDEDCLFEGGACDNSSLLCYDRNAVEVTTTLHPNDDIVPLMYNKMDDKNKMAKDDKMAGLREHGVLCDAVNSCPDSFECLAGICVCPNGYYAEGKTSACYAELGSPSTEEQCVGFLAEVQNGICTCPNNFYYSENMRDCTKMSRFITDYCMTDIACLTFGASASCQEPKEWGLRNCECDAEVSVWDESRKLCRYFAGAGEYCEIDNDCYVEGVNVTCAAGENGGYCACPAGFAAIDGLCVTTGLGLGDTCRASIECTEASNAECVDSKCICADGFVQYGNDCAPKLGGVCSSDLDCVIGNTVCVTADSSTTCQCHPNFIQFNDECWPAITNQNETCQVPAQCWQLLGEYSICEDDRCICPKGYHMRDSSCWQMRGIFDTCSRNSECYLEGNLEQLVCRNSICQCDFKYPYSEELGSCTSAATVLKTSMAVLIISVAYLLL